MQHFYYLNYRYKYISNKKLGLIIEESLVGWIIDFKWITSEWFNCRITSIIKIRFIVGIITLNLVDWSLGCWKLSYYIEAMNSILFFLNKLFIFNMNIQNI